MDAFSSLHASFYTHNGNGKIYASAIFRLIRPAGEQTSRVITHVYL